MTIQQPGRASNDQWKDRIRDVDLDLQHSSRPLTVLFTK